VVVTAGEAALCGLADAPVDRPVLPVGAGLGLHGVPGPAATGAVEAVAAGDYRVCDHPTLELSVDGEPVAAAVLDASLITSEPARISEYAVRAGGDRVDRFRADGVVVATPAGSAGYASAAGGPLLGAGTGLAVAPVAAFSTAADAWVLVPPIELTVERDEGTVTLLADDREVRRIAHGETATMTRGGSLPLVSVGGGLSGGLENANEPRGER
jgi:NAD+ kinase